METFFMLSGWMVLPFWGLMIFLPRWRITERLMRTPWVCAAPAAFYAALVIPRIADIWWTVSRPELSGVAALLGSPVGATIAWMHFLTFDLFVGRWIYIDSRERGVSTLVVSPALFLTLMLGPIGFLFYLIARHAHGYLRAKGNIVPVSIASKERS